MNPNTRLETLQQGLLALPHYQASQLRIEHEREIITLRQTPDGLYILAEEVVRLVQASRT